MHSQFAWRLVKRAALRGGVHVDSTGTSSVSPHTLRRTLGSDLLNRGVRLEVVSKLLGHASTTITEQAYAELLDSTIVAEVLAATA
jgi:site-specific recombinase XerD